MTSARGSRSHHPVDRLIRELIGSGRAAGPSEIDQIIGRIGTAPFSQQVVDVDPLDQGRTYLGRTLGSKEDSLSYHLFKRVLVQREWAAGTTPAQYVADLHSAAVHPLSRLVLYRLRG